MAGDGHKGRGGRRFSFVSAEEIHEAESFFEALVGTPQARRREPARAATRPEAEASLAPDEAWQEDDATALQAHLRVVDADLRPLTDGAYAMHQDGVVEQGRLDAQGHAPFGRIDPDRPFRFEIRDRVCVIRTGAFFDPDDAGLEYGGTWFDWARVRDDRDPDRSFWPHYHREMDAVMRPGIDRLAQHEHLTRRPIQVAAPYRSRLEQVVLRATPVEIRVGPLLRYCDHERAVVWLETETPALVRVRHRAHGSSDEASSHASTIKVGGRHFAAVELKGLTEDARHEFRVELAPLPATGPVPVEDEELREAFPELSPAVAAAMERQLGEVSLDRGPWISFKTLRQRYDEELRFVTGSCRMHPGDQEGRHDLRPDLMEGLGHWLRITPREQWPEFALYTGDQIYSDEVADDHAERLAQGRLCARVPGPTDPAASARDKLVDGAWAGRFAHRFTTYRDPPVRQVEAVRDALKRLDSIHQRYPDIRGIYLEYPEADPRAKLRERHRTLKNRREISGAKREASDERKAREAIALLPTVDNLLVSSEPFRVFLPQWKVGFDTAMRRNPMRNRYLDRNLLLWNIPDFEHQLPTLADRGPTTVVRGPGSKGHPAAAGGRHAADFAEYAYFYERAWTSDRNVRVLLAHLPTFLVFDDHELTDDWNSGVEWVRMLHNRKDDLRMWPKTLSDAFAAYWLYQGWGNRAPSQWPSSDPRVAALQQAQRRGTDALPRLRRLFHDACFRPLPSSDRKAAYQTGLSLDWHYRLPFEPPFLVPDCRSRRKMVPSDERLRVIDHSDKRKRPRSQTIDDAQLRWMREILVDRWRGGSVAFIATSTPLLMQKKVMDMMRAPETTAKAWAGGVDLASIGAALASSTALGRASIELIQLFRRRKDLEHMIRDKSWRDLWGLATQMRKTGRPPKALVLVSGDVHHSYCMTGNPAGPGRPRPELVQITCSGFKTGIRDDFTKKLAEVQGSRDFRIDGRRLVAGFLAKDGRGTPRDLILYQNAAAVVRVTMGPEVEIQVDLLSGTKHSYADGPESHVFRYTSGPQYQPLRRRRGPAVP